MDNDGSTVLSADRHMSDADDDHLGEEDNIENEVESQYEGGVGAGRTAQVLLSVLGDSSDQDDSSEEAEDDESIECYEQPEENDEDEDDDEDFAAALVMTGLGRNTDGKRNGSSQKKNARKPLPTRRNTNTRGTVKSTTHVSVSASSKHQNSSISTSSSATVRASVLATSVTRARNGLPPKKPMNKTVRQHVTVVWCDIENTHHYTCKFCKIVLMKRKLDIMNVTRVADHFINKCREVPPSTRATILKSTQSSKQAVKWGQCVSTSSGKYFLLFFHATVIVLFCLLLFIFILIYL
jgi:hypothetical protein